MPSNTGIFGGYPGSRNQVFIKYNANVKELLAKGILPTDINQIEGELQLLEAKPKFLSINSDDILLYRWSGGGGYGDPLDRDPQSVVLDVKKGLVSTQFAKKVYGVVLNDDITLNWEETQLLREKIREVRATSKIQEASMNETSKNSSASTMDSGESKGERRIGEYLRFFGDNIVCKCGHRFCKSSDDPIKYALTSRVPPSELGPLFGEADSGYEFFEAYCPNCKTRFFSHVVERGKEMGIDVKLKI